MRAKPVFSTTFNTAYLDFKIVYIRSLMVSVKKILWKSLIKHLMEFEVQNYQLHTMKKSL